MRPLRLEVEGFTAFRESQKVDFEPLELFVITGPTGAGKTSILDAMVFALYGQVPRLGGKSGISDLVALGQALARVQFEFSLDGGMRYRVARRLPRHGAQTAKLERLEGAEWVDACERGGVTEANRELLALLGLDYGSFTKAVVLPQGEFHRFLKGDPAERREVLVSLLGVSHFREMGRRANARRTRLQAGIEAVEKILEDQYADATAAAIAAAREAASEVERSAARLRDTLRDSRAHSARASVHRQAAGALESARSELVAVAGGLRQQFDQCRLAEEELIRVRREEEAAAGALAAQERSAEEARGAAARVDAETGGVELITRLGVAVGRLAEIGSEQEALVGARDKASVMLTAASEAVSRLDTEVAVAGGRLEQALEAEKARANQEQALAAPSRELAVALDQARQRAREVEVAREQHQVAAAAVEPLRAAAERARQAAEVAERELAEHERLHRVASLVAGLGPGDPCPVCSAPLSAAIAVPDGEEKAIQHAQSGLSAARAAAERAAGQAARAEGQTQQSQAELQGSEERLATALGEHAGLEALATASTAAAAAHASAVSALEAAQAMRGAVEDEHRQVVEQARAAEADRDRCRLLLEAREAEIERLARTREEVKSLLAEHLGTSSPEGAQGLVEERRARLQEATRSTGAAEAELAVRRGKHDEARVALEAASNAVHRIDITIEGLRSRAASAWAAAQRLAGGRVLAVLPEPAAERVEALQALAGACDAVAAVLDGLASAEEQAASTLDLKIVELFSAAGGEGDADAVAGLAALEAMERTAAEQLVRVRSELELAERRLEQRTEMEAQIAEDRDQSNVLGMLATELRADHFVEYLVQETLELLAATASNELRRISDGRYSLVAGQKDFEVIDHANADERRSVKTLSGGETFLASLALALALSRHVGDLAAEGLGTRLEAVFIDEGFGSLDPDTLNEVIDALERLRADNLMVGVISHVPALAERIGVGLQVVKSDAGSEIRSNLQALASG